MNSLVFLSVLTIIISCSGQNITHEANNNLSEQDLMIVKGDTVRELGKNIMIVYHSHFSPDWQPSERPDKVRIENLRLYIVCFRFIKI